MCVHSDLLGVLKVDLTIVLPSLNAIIMINSVQDNLSVLLTTHRDTFLLVTSTLAHHPGSGTAISLSFALGSIRCLKEPTNVIGFMNIIT